MLGDKRSFTNILRLETKLSMVRWFSYLPPTDRLPLLEGRESEF